MYRPEKPVSKRLNSKIATNAAECPMCHEVFTSPNIADKHLKRKSWTVDTYRMVCQNPADVGLSIGSRGYWTIPNDNKWWEKEDD